MKLLHRNILAEKIPDSNTTPSGIIMQRDLLQECRAKVIMVSDKVEFIKVGDIVKYYPNTGTPINYNGKDCLLLKEDENTDYILNDRA